MGQPPGDPDACLSRRPARVSLLAPANDRLPIEVFGYVLAADFDVALAADGEAGLAAALATWPAGQTPKIHFSSPRLDVEVRRVRSGRRVERRLVLPQLRAHADLIDPIGFEAFLRDAPAGRDFDIMLEAKAKDIALLRLRDQLAERGLPSEDGRVTVPASAAAS